MACNIDFLFTVKNNKFLVFFSFSPYNKKSVISGGQYYNFIIFIKPKKIINLVFVSTFKKLLQKKESDACTYVRLH